METSTIFGATRYLKSLVFKDFCDSVFKEMTADLGFALKATKDFLRKNEENYQRKFAEDRKSNLEEELRNLFQSQNIPGSRIFYKKSILF